MAKKKPPTRKFKKHLSYACTGCGACCTDTMVPVNDTDVKRLMKVTGLKADKIVRLFDGSETQFERDRDGWIHFTYGKRILGLKKKDDHCMFLDDDKRCIAYEGRAMTCRTFPLHIHYDTKGRMTDIQFIPGVKCKRGKGKPKPLKPLLENAIREDVEDERFYKKIARWNREKRKGGKAAFLKFLGLV